MLQCLILAHKRELDKGFQRARCSVHFLRKLHSQLQVTVTQRLSALERQQCVRRRSLQVVANNTGMIALHAHSRDW